MKEQLKKFRDIRLEKTRVYVDSSNVERVMYDNITEILTVRFNDGSTYTYDNISEKVFEKIIDGVDSPITSGKGQWGAWRKGVGPSVGATLYQRVIRYNRGRKGGSFR